MVVKLAAGVEIPEDARPSNVSLLPVSICYQKTLNLDHQNSAEARRWMAMAHVHAQDAPVYPGDVPATAGGAWCPSSGETCVA